MIIRYSWFTDGVKPSPTGRYVLHEDYVALEKRLYDKINQLAEKDPSPESADGVLLLHLVSIVEDYEKHNHD